METELSHEEYGDEVEGGCFYQFARASSLGKISPMEVANQYRCHAAKQPSGGTRQFRSHQGMTLQGQARDLSASWVFFFSRDTAE